MYVTPLSIKLIIIMTRSLIKGGKLITGNKNMNKVLFLSHNLLTCKIEKAFILQIHVLIILFSKL